MNLFLKVGVFLLFCSFSFPVGSDQLEIKEIAIKPEIETSAIRNNLITEKENKPKPASGQEAFE